MKDPNETACVLILASMMDYLYEVGEEEVLRRLRDCGEDLSYFKHLDAKLKEDE